MKCTNCKRSALVDKNPEDEEYIMTCFRCGYNYSRKLQWETEESVQYQEESNGGFGVFKLVHQSGDEILGQFRHPMTDRQYSSFKDDYAKEETVQDESFLVNYSNGEFTIQYGEPPENFYLSFEQYTKKMTEKYAENRVTHSFVPFEE